MCECGCGESVSLPTSRFKQGHNKKAKAVPKSYRPALCACGCGHYTSLWRGEPRRFISGHNTRSLTSEEQSRRGKMQVEKHDPNKTSHLAKDSYAKKGGRHYHRVVAEEMLGRPLRKGEVVHHIDGNKHNNDPSNLEVLPSQSDHIKLHHNEMHEAFRRKLRDVL